MTSRTPVRLHDPVAALAHLSLATPAELDEAAARLDRAGLNRAELLARAFVGLRRNDRDRACADFLAAAYPGPERGPVARALVLGELGAATLGQPFDKRRACAVLDAGRLDEPDAGLLHGMLDVAAVLADDPDYDPDALTARVDRLAAAAAGGPMAPAVVSLRMALLVKRGQDRNFYGDGRQVRAYAQALREMGGTGAEREVADLLAEAADGLVAAQRGDAESAVATMQRLAPAVERMPPDKPGVAMVRNLIGALAALTGGPGGREQDPYEPGLSAQERAFRLYANGMGAARRAMAARDVEALTRAVATLRRACDTAPPGYPHRPMMDASLSRLLCALAESGGGQDLVDEALRRLAAARGLTRDLAHPMWAAVEIATGHAYRLAGRRAQGRAAGARALRGHAWSVLLQSGGDDAAAAARHAVDDATEVARWCLADGDAAGALNALDAGRSLMLHAATVVADIPARLRRLGHDALARRWAAGADDPDVRRDVLTALTGGDLADVPVPDVLDPPSPDAIRAALRAQRHDAIVYLMPGPGAGLPGAAVVLPNGSDPFALTLPSLTGSGDEPVRNHSSLLAARSGARPRPPGAGAAAAPAGSARDAGEADGGDGGADEPDATEAWRAALDRLTRWAWRAAAGPLLAETGRWGLTRAPRLLLVPMGGLAGVPWHAARAEDGTYAVQLAEFSYVPSARLLCQNAARDPIPQDGGGLVVGDPTRDLPDAYAEALAVREAFYPDADLQTDTTPDGVLAWLRHPAPMLHLACHGAVEPGLDGSHLLLAGHARLTATDILGTRRSAALGLVALAACTTGVPSGTFDEAFSLATAFLVAGARTVFGSLWPVPSDATSVLMFMAHYYLRAESRRPADALNRAQRWMLDPARRIPAEMPAALAARAAALHDPEPAAWAGFQHLGW